MTDIGRPTNPAAPSNPAAPTNPPPGRARKRAIRAYAARARVPYSVAARLIDQSSPAGPDDRAGVGRTIYPPTSDTHRQWLIDCRAHRSRDTRVQDSRQAADLPAGRAWHLAARFPPARGEDGTGVGLLYHGEKRREALVMLYRVVAHETPHLVPSAGDLAWQAEMGEETAVDTACAMLDRTARLLLDDDTRLRDRVVDMLISTDSTPCSAPDRFDDPTSWWWSREGARHILDATLMVADDGHAPGTRVRLLSGALGPRTATIVGALWASSGPPIGYRVWPDAAGSSVAVDPFDLVVLTSPERDGRRSPHV